MWTCGQFFTPLINSSFILFLTALDYNLALVVVFAKGRRRATFFLFENSVEIADVIKTAVVANFGNAGGGVYEVAGRIAKAGVNDVVRNGLPGLCSEVSAEGCWCHSGNVGKSL